MKFYLFKIETKDDTNYDWKKDSFKNFSRCCLTFLQAEDVNRSEQRSVNNLYSQRTLLSAEEENFSRVYSDAKKERIRYLSDEPEAAVFIGANLWDKACFASI